MIISSSRLNFEKNYQDEYIHIRLNNTLNAISQYKN